MKKNIMVIIGGMLLWALPVYTQQHTHHEGATPAPSTTQAPRTTPVAPPPAPTAPRTTPAPTSPAPATQATNTAEPGRPVVALPRSNAEYKLGPGDLVEISVFGVDEFRQDRRINSSGIIQLPFIDAIKAAGMTTAELEGQLTAQLKDRVIKNPQVAVFVKEYRSQPLYVLGAVRTPGQYQMTTQLRIVDAISMAGGILNSAAQDAVIQRPLAGGGEETIRVDLAKLFEQGDLALNVFVQGGDVIHVAERKAETVYVVGEVNRAGAFGIPPKQDLRVSQAIAWAGGPMKTAQLSKGLLVRYLPNGQREEKPVDFGKIMKGQLEDFFVRSDDIIFIPGSAIKTFGYGLLNGLPSTVATIPYAIP